MVEVPGSSIKKDIAYLPVRISLRNGKKPPVRVLNNQATLPNGNYLWHAENVSLFCWS
jgi:hypothetical protein